MFSCWRTWPRVQLTLYYIPYSNWHYSRWKPIGIPAVYINIYYIICLAFCASGFVCYLFLAALQITLELQYFFALFSVGVQQFFSLGLQFSSQPLNFLLKQLFLLLHTLLPVLQHAQIKMINIYSIYIILLHTAPVVLQQKQQICNRETAILGAWLY